MKKRYISIFCIYLVISLSVMSSLAYAQILEDLRVSGVENVQGYRRASSDTTLIQVKAASSDSSINITSDYVRAGSEMLAFNDCAYAGYANVWICTLRDPDDYDADVYPFTIHLYNNPNPADTSESVKNIAGEIVADGDAPNLTILGLGQDERNVTVSYRITDTACETCGTRCSGIGKIEFTDASFVEVINTSDCIYEGQSSILIPVSETREASVNLRVYDRVGNMQYIYTDPIFIDNVEPKIDDSFEVWHGGGKLTAISTISSTRGLPGVEVVVYIEEHNLSRVVGDLTYLNPTSPIVEAYRGVEAECEPEEEGSIRQRCVWDGISMVLNAGDINIEVEAEDTAGNKANKTVTASFVVDNEPPEVVVIGTQACIDDLSKCYIKNGTNEIVVRMRETGSGFNAKNPDLVPGAEVHNMLLDLSSILGSSYKDVYSEMCVKVSADEWACFWNVTLAGTYAAKDEYDVSVVYGSRDDAKNNVVGKTQTVLRHDSKNPVVTKAEIYPITDEPETVSHTLIAGRPVLAGLEIKDELPVTAVADFSNVIPDANEVEGTCGIDASGKIMCAWPNAGTAKSVTRYSGLKNTEIYFNLTDLAGNTVRHVERVDLLWKAGVAENFWTVKKITPSPSKYDVKMFDLVPLRVYFAVVMEGVNENVNVHNLAVEGCESKTTGVAIDGASVFKGADQNPWIKIVARKSGDVSKGKLTVNCKLKIVSKVDTPTAKYITQPEVEDLNLTLIMYDSAFNLNATVNSIVKDVEDSVLFKLTNAGVMKTLYKLLHIAESICKIQQLVSKIISGVSSVMRILDILRGIPGGKIKADHGQKFASRMRIKMTRGMFRPLYQFCQFLSCDTQEKLKCSNDADCVSLKGKCYTCNTNTKQCAPKCGQGMTDDCKKACGETDQQKNKAAMEDAKRRAQNKVKTLKKAECSKGATERYSITLENGVSYKEVTVRGEWDRFANKCFPKAPFFPPAQAVPTDPSSSLYLSITYRCIPGIIKNLEKYRNIQCDYLDCVVNMVPNGVPMHVCKYKKHYLTCKYVLGEIFQAIPYLNWYKNIASQIANILSNPVQWFIGRNLCSTRITDLVGTNAFYHIKCTLPETVKEFEAAKKALENFGDNIDFDYVDKCENFTG